ncbi:hypothetical protein [Macrococcus animalis]|uniref:hypothetical protein n=1 Tax=Macrococcus animalis TaxID=3395467 RepID=UPI0039BDAFCB
MIKVGDWVTHDITGERFEITEYNDKYVWLRKENGFRDITTHETLYKWLYLQQKQRADELETNLKVYKDLVNGWKTTSVNNEKRANRLEKQWDDFRESINALYQNSKIQDSISTDHIDKAITETYKEVLQKIHDLEEDGE